MLPPENFIAIKYLNVVFTPGEIHGNEDARKGDKGLIQKNEAGITDRGAVDDSP